MGAHPVVSELSSLAGEQLSAVSFVCDYVELHFGGPVLRALSDPIVNIHGVSVQFPHQGSRDMLCLLIGKEVSAARETSEALQVEFDDDVTVRVPLTGYSASAEAAHFIPVRDGRRDGANMVIWESLG